MGLIKNHCGGDSGGPLLLKQNESTTFCLLGTVAGLLHMNKEEGEINMVHVCDGGSPRGRITNEKDLGYYNFVPKMTREIQNLPKDL